MMVLRPVRVNESQDLLELFRQSALWLQVKGIDQWQGWLSPGPELLNWVQAGLANGEYYFAEEAGARTGVVRIQDSDDLFWGPQQEPAGYIHSLATVRNGVKGSGKRILLEVEQKLRQQGVGKIRLDCGVDSRALREYYKGFGMKEVGNRVVGDYHLVLMEKDL